MVVCNKQDLPFAKNPLQVEREMTQEIEQIRKVRKAAHEQEQDMANRLDDDADGDNQTEMSYIESLKGKFSFEQVPNKVSFVGS